MPDPIHLRELTMTHAPETRGVVVTILVERADQTHRYRYTGYAVSGPPSFTATESFEPTPGVPFNASHAVRCGPMTQQIGLDVTLEACESMVEVIPPRHAQSDDIPKRWEHRAFGGAPTTDDLLDRHLRRTGAREAALQDPAAHLQVAMLRDFLRMLQAALDDEHVESDVVRRIVERVMYGAVPHPAEVERRLAIQQRWIDDLGSRSVTHLGQVLP
jgi:hypothetical protein